MTLAVIASRTLSGLHAHAVRVETHLGPGLPSFNVVGLPDTEVRESRERVRAAIINSGFNFPAGRITVNLSPADIPKESGRFDLPIAVGLLLAAGQLAPQSEGSSSDGGLSRAAPDPLLAGLVLAGELSLTGALVPVAAALVIALSVARESPGATLILPAGSAEQAARVEGLRVLSARSLADVAAHVAGLCGLPDAIAAAWPEAPPAPCLSDVRGQPGARRALEVAAAGGHSLLMVGPPGGRQEHAGRAPAWAVAAAGAAAGAGGRGHRRGGGCAGHTHGHAAVSRPASLGVGHRHGGRWRPPAPGRDQPGPSWRAVPGRTARVQPAHARGAARAAGDGQGGHRARPAYRAVPRPLPIGGGDEPLPLRLARPSSPRLPVHARPGGALCRQGFGAAARPDRPVCDPAAARSGQPAGPPPARPRRRCGREWRVAANARWHGRASPMPA